MGSESTTAKAKKQLLTRVRRHTAEIVERVVVRAQSEMPAYAVLSTDTIARITNAVVDRLLAALRDGRPLSDDDLHALREYGETLARQGVSLSDIQNGWRIAVREMLHELTASADPDTTDRMLLELTHDLLDIVDQAAMSYSGGHRDIELALARQDQQARADFTRAALLGALSPAELTIRAEQFGLNPSLEYRAFRTRAETRNPRDPHELAPQRLAAARGYTTTIDDDIAGFIEKSKTLPGDEPIGFGPPVRLHDLGRSFRLAGRMLATAHRFGRTGSVDLDQLGLLPAVAVDTDLGEELARRYLDPLTPHGDAIIDTIDCYLDEGMRIDHTAKRLFLHPNTIRYRFRRFEELTGADLHRAHTALQVWWAIQHRRAAAHS
ncbi:PucR family transcriptional regulator [Nocardia crassostreae]|uniref:PucR family transcriptional regulator n=1 Tax=Nocardia crassostreae TaxID=53428 RepID=UPI00082EE42A|nr:helix-turn-helix domain-containing protein [Nocardia crassostreae]